jgi:hypothetical protein
MKEQRISEINSYQSADFRARSIPQLQLLLNEIDDLLRNSDNVAIKN